jgi:hypothetical protein
MHVRNLMGYNRVLLGGLSDDPKSPIRLPAGFDGAKEGCELVSLWTVAGGASSSTPANEAIVFDE